MIDGATHNGAGRDEPPALTAGAVARAVGGELRGDPAIVVSAVAPLHRAGPTELSFLALPRYAGLAADTRAGILLVSPDLAHVDSAARATVVVEKPHEALLDLLPHFYREAVATPGVHPTAVIGAGVALGDRVSVGAYAVVDEGARLADGVTIGPHVTVGAGVEIGDGSLIHAGATLYRGAVIGRRVIVHSGARIASDGFGYVFGGGAHRKIPHVGRCIIGDDVEIGANTTIDRGSVDDTIVGAGTKIDNLVQVGHNVHIGRLCLLMAQVGIAGSAHVEDGAILAGQAGIGGHRTVGKGARIGGQAGVFGDVPAGETWSGYPARPHKESLRAQAALFRLPSLLRRIERLLDGSERTS